MSSENQWLEAAGRAPLLTKDEEILLARKIQAAIGFSSNSTNPQERRAVQQAARAKERFVTGNLRLVYHIADKHFRGIVPADGFVDLLQAGAEGVLHAATKFDPSKGVKFSTYAAWWIRQRIQIHLDWHSRTIRPPTTIVRQLRGLPHASRNLMAKLGRLPNAAELAAAVDLSEEEVNTALIRACTPISLDRALRDDDGDTIGDRLAISETIIDDDIQLEELKNAMAVLPRLQRLAIQATYFSDSPTLSAFAQAEGISAAQAKEYLQLGMTRLKLLRPGPVVQLRLPLPNPVIQITSRKYGRRRRRRHGPVEGQLELQICIHSKTLRKGIVMS